MQWCDKITTNPTFIWERDDMQQTNLTARHLGCKASFGAVEDSLPTASPNMKSTEKKLHEEVQACTRQFRYWSYINSIR